MKTIVILISGRGSNLQALIDVSGRESWPAKIAAVISDRPDAAGLDLARRVGIATAVVDAKNFAQREAFEEALQFELDRFQPDLILLAGFLRILSAAFVGPYAGRMLNIHPSLLPAFPGLHTHRQALRAGVRAHGATVHFVSAGLDSGPIIAQAVVPVFPGDSEALLDERVRKQEHRLYPRVVRWMIDGKVALVGEEVSVAAPAAELLLDSPGRAPD